MIHNRRAMADGLKAPTSTIIALAPPCPSRAPPTQSHAERPRSSPGTPDLKFDGHRQRRDAAPPPSSSDRLKQAAISHVGSSGSYGDSLTIFGRDRLQHRSSLTWCSHPGSPNYPSSSLRRQDSTDATSSSLSATTSLSPAHQLSTVVR